MNFELKVTLESELITLRPLQEDDFENLYSVAADPLIWEQHPAKERSEREGFKAFFKEAIDSKGAFAVIDSKTGEIIGSTRFYRVKEVQNAIEIGWTFLARKYWGGAYNKSMKDLMMTYAFKFVENVLFYIHESNFRSQKAVEKLGGKKITVLESQVLDPRQSTNVIYQVARPK